MKIAVQGAFRKFNEQFEGVVPYMYLDVRGLVTVGVGNLIDPIEEAVQVPFRWKSDRRLATREEISGEWRSIKRQPLLASAGHRSAARVTQLEVADEDIGELIRERLLANVEALLKRPTFNAWNDMPADAQMAVLSMAWAVGVNGLSKFPKLLMAIARKDYIEAAVESEISTVGNPGIKPRNAANFLLFTNAAKVIELKRDREILFYPDATKGISV